MSAYQPQDEHVEASTAVHTETQDAHGSPDIGLEGLGFNSGYGATRLERIDIVIDDGVDHSPDIGIDTRGSVPATIASPRTICTETLLRRPTSELYCSKRVVPLA